MNGEFEKKAREYGRDLAKLGADLGDAKFSYKIRTDTKKEYWESRIKDFELHIKKSIEYYSHAYLLIKLISDEESQMFLLHTSKFHHLCQSLISAMKKARDNPSIANPKERQKSLWSRNAIRQIKKCSDECLRQEKDMNETFREFCMRHSEILDLSDK